MHVVIDIGAMQNQMRKLEEENMHLKATLAEKEKQLGETNCQTPRRACFIEDSR